MLKHGFTTAALLAVPLAFSASARAQDAANVSPGLYVGAGVTQAQWDASKFKLDNFDDKDNSWKIAAGYRFNPYFALEGNYVDFGKASAPATPAQDPFDAKAHAWAGYAVGIIPISMFDLYAKAGAARITAEGNYGPQGFSDDKTEFAYGAGARWRLGNFGVNLEYEKYDTTPVGDLDLITLGASYKFGASGY